MNPLIHSKHLYVTRECNDFILTHELTSTSLKVSNDVIRLINLFKKPMSFSAIENSNYNMTNEAITYLLSKKFLVSTNDYETSLIFKQWKNLFNKPSYSYTENSQLIINYFTDDVKETDILVKEIYKICLDMHTSILQFSEPISVYFLTKVEFDEFSKNFNIPMGACAFVYAKTLLVLDYETFFIKENSHIFFPTIRHEALHILFGQNRYTLPFWLEEGICELYSFKCNTEYINNHLKNESLIDFYELYKNRVRTVRELSINNLLYTNTYSQFQSFTGFILSKLGEKNFWDMLQNTSICEDFDKLLSDYSNLSLKTECNDWKNFIKSDN